MPRKIHPTWDAYIYGVSPSRPNPTKPRPCVPRKVRYIDQMADSLGVNPEDLRELVRSVWAAAAGEDKVHRMKCGKWMNRLTDDIHQSETD